MRDGAGSCSKRFAQKGTTPIEGAIYEMDNFAQTFNKYKK